MVSPSSTEMPPAQGTIGYRRNGKKQACEPCRKGKLACDHGSPFCGRCVRRKTTEKCIYHPAPMTKIRNSTAPATQITTEGSLPASFTQPPPPEESNKEREKMPYPGRYPERGNAGSQSGVKPERPRGKKDSWKEAVYPQSTRYSGPTSITAVFSEHRSPGNEDLLEIGEAVRRHPGAWKFGQPLAGRYRPEGPGERTKQVVKALMNVPSKEICESLLTTQSTLNDITLNPTMITHCVKSLWSEFGTQLAMPRTTEGLEKIAEVLFKNEEHPLPPSPVDGIDWLNTFMGRNIRLEMIGVMFCFFGKAYLTLQDWDPLFKVPENHDRDRKETAWRMKECADICRQMCHFAETVNEIVVSLSLNLEVLESLCAGDQTYSQSHRHGDVITTAISAGMHRLPEYSNTPITTASEYKRRLFSKLYYLDKVHSAINGIPPLLGRVYCDVKPCLDIADEELFLPPHALAVVVSRLDLNGWNTSGKIYDISVARAIWQLCAVREEILEMALGVNVLVSPERVEELRTRTRQVLELLPDQLRYYSDVDRKMPRESTGKTLFSQACLELDYIQNIFLIDRVSIVKGFPNNERLLNTAMEMLGLTLMFWISRDKLIFFASYFNWIITFYGIPSAGVICVELLKYRSTPQNHLTFSRSDAIQKLTLFIGFLEWIRPTDGNYNLANRLKKVVRKVLDRVLEPPPIDAAPPPNRNGMEPQFDPLILSPFDNLNDMDWLNTIDWTQGSWMEYN